MKPPINENIKYKSIEDVILMFKDGFKRYNEDALFHKCINAIYIGENQIKLLDDVISMNRRLMKQYSNDIRNGTINSIVNPTLSD